MANGLHRVAELSDMHTAIEQLIDQARQVRESLLQYCRLDTLAMVKLVGFLRKIVDDSL